MTSIAEQAAEHIRREKTLEVMAQINLILMHTQAQWALPAILIMAAKVCVAHSTENDDAIIEQFRLCLLDARINPEGAMQ